MTKMFEFFESGKALEGVMLGLIDPRHLEKYDIYKTYLDLLTKGSNADARKKIMVNCDCDQYIITRAVMFFEGEEKQDQRRSKKDSFKIPQQTPNDNALLLK